MLSATCLAASASDLCPPPELWDGAPAELVISEDDFTFENALEALSNLTQIIQPKNKSGSAGFIARGNSELVLKGYVLRSECLGHGNESACEAFCQFRNEKPLWFD